MTATTFSLQCSYDGCSFKASRKTLKLHWIQMHASGKMRIKLDTPEEIAKWREERKRKYPTVANVEKKKEEETKRQASGQVLKTKNFRYRKGERGGRTFHRGGLNHFNKRPHQRREQDLKNKTENGSQISEKVQDKRNEERQCQETKVLQNGEDPLSIVLGDCDGAESDSETKEVSLPNGSSPAFTNGTNLTTSETSVPGDNSMQLSALTSLCSAYASDSDECKEQGEINNNKETDEDLVGKPEIRKSSGPLSSKEEKKYQTKRRKRKFQRRKNKSKIDAKGDSKSVRVRKSTLLEKLLAPEIRHERNVILQCLRYIVKKNFFGVEQTDPSGQYVAEL
ncbi:LOW QUALITY PROTEIN: nuclear fragile X mental retardation-interacting protein 1-like [Acropora millepora]|uniref:LOW QUALITY PROTEIN: nuclear fragile X mental retardation-interacting protein 1-like n=1 Tax=Acropora millepora TaxID=45264 RepID=UPI001CF0ED4C|nr:LOW QUALITY PROTEIN: nuclear fragile X mental retardation-interacting protein 1-like [Acropora millepora]